MYNLAERMSVIHIAVGSHCGFALWIYTAVALHTVGSHRGFTLLYRCQRLMRTNEERSVFLNLSIRMIRWISAREQRTEQLIKQADKSV